MTTCQKLLCLILKKKYCFGIQVFLSVILKCYGIKRILTGHNYGISSKNSCLNCQKHLVLEVVPCKVISGQSTEEVS